MRLSSVPLCAATLVAPLGLISTSGCAQPPAVTSPSAGIEPYELTCDSGAAAALVGRKRDRDTEEAAKRLSGASRVRWIPPGSGVTADHDTGRINLEVDAAGRIVSIRCG